MTDTLVPPRYGPVTRHAPRRWRRIRSAIAVAFVTAATVVTAEYLLDDAHRDYLSTDGWPREGQGAYQFGDGVPAASPHERPVPIASLAKVMTAYLVLQHFPLERGDPGPRFRVTMADVKDTEQRRQTDQSVIDVRRGERLTERQALIAMLLPSANNVAVLVARQVGGSVPAFVAEMNRTAGRLGMTDTIYTDPSGFDEGTVSTATDQLRLARVAARNATLAELMAIRSYRLPVAGDVENTDTLLGQDGFVGMKTGSDDAAGGCFMFRSRREVDGRITDLVGVVLGQHGRNLITAGLYAAKQLADRVAPTAAS
jgi:D-alanyl-D-alanine carboxypeptidase (penicillin-binding protein 5/6)